MQKKYVPVKNHIRDLLHSYPLTPNQQYMVIKAHKTIYYDKVEKLYTVAYYDPVTGVRAWSGGQKKLKHAETQALMALEMQYENCEVETFEVEVAIESANQKPDVT